MSDRLQQPLVYSCSGCSSAAQLANSVALKLDRADIAEMSCIAGVGGDVPQIARAHSDGCGRVSALVQPRTAEGACP